MFSIIIPTLNGMNEIGCKYKGILYAGLMIENNEPKLIEYNIRFGDPECQVLMMRLENDLVDIILSSINGNLANENLYWTKNPCITIVAASKGYPESFENNKEIRNLPADLKSNNIQLFHASTIERNNKIFTNGGRVLNSTVCMESLKEAKIKALEILDSLEWENKYYRRDIGWRVIK